MNKGLALCEQWSCGFASDECFAHVEMTALSGKEPGKEPGKEQMGPARGFGPESHDLAICDTASSPQLH